jgi:selenocysteine lyase/cysteine desulfurase
VLNDAIQSVGAIDVNVKKDDVDFFLTGSYKWQCGSEGTGIFYMKQELIDKFEPEFRNYMCPASRRYPLQPQRPG